MVFRAFSKPNNVTLSKDHTLNITSLNVVYQLIPKCSYLACNRTCAERYFSNAGSLRLAETPAMH